ncbi:MAG: transglutaminase family protein [Desulfobacterales bacterium]|nr:transglutaminase family protein [Desulfobacterales bacterium]
MARSDGKINLAMVAGIGCSLLFVVLLTVRLGLLKDNRVVPLPMSRKTPASYTWHEIFQESDKIGYSHRRVIPRKDGYQLSETTFMRINTMGMVQDINLLTTGVLAKDMSLSEFTFQLKSSRFNFKASGKVAHNVIQLLINGQSSSMPVKTPLYLTAGIFDAVSAVDIQIGETRTFNIFDPASMSQRPIQVTFTGLDNVKIMEKEIKARKLETNFMGAKHTAWVTLDGEIVQETGPLGITLKKSDANQALSNISGHTQDLTRLVAVDPGVFLKNTEKIEKITYLIEGVSNLPEIDGGRQTLSGNTLTVSLEKPAAPGTIPAPEPGLYLQPSPFVQSDHPDIVTLAGSIVNPDIPGRKKVIALKNWLFTEIEKRPVLSVPNALETLKNRMGDCNEHAVLFAALSRATGVPARIEAGLVYLNGRFYYHAWNSVFLNQWITIDTLMNQFPADATHIRFTRGGPDSQMDLMGVIGKVNLEIVDIQYD